MIGIECRSLFCAFTSFGNIGLSRDGPPSVSISLSVERTALLMPHTPPQAGRADRRHHIRLDRRSSRMIRLGSQWRNPTPDGRLAPALVERPSCFVGFDSRPCRLVIIREPAGRVAVAKKYRVT